jgi:hypothetical protein
VDNVPVVTIEEEPLTNIADFPNTEHLHLPFGGLEHKD